MEVDRELCDEFIRKFNALMPPPSGPNPFGKYEKCLYFAFDQIRTTAKDIRENFGDFIISDGKKMGFYKRVVCMRSNEKKGSKKRYHPFVHLNERDVVTDSKAKADMIVFFNAHPEDYVAVLMFATIQHKVVGFFTRSPSVIGISSKFQVRFYDSNVGSNLIEIAKCFLSPKVVTDKGFYSNALHGRTNQNGDCAALALLEIFLHFRYNQNPFKRQLVLRKYLGNTNHYGRQGPQLPDENYKRINRNRSVPYNQMTANKPSSSSRSKRARK